MKDDMDARNAAESTRSLPDIDGGRAGSISPDSFPWLSYLGFPACIVSPAGNLVSCNDAWGKRASLRSADGGEAPWIQAFHPADRYDVLSHLRQAALVRQECPFECRLASEQGAYTHCLVHFRKLDDAHAPSRYLCVAIDIEDRKQREERLQRRATMQADMLNISVDCIKLITADGALVHMNRPGCQALGVPENSSFGMPWLPLLPQDVWDAGRQALTFAQAGEFARFPGRSVLPGQKPQYWDNMLTPVLDAEGHVASILCVSREVTLERETVQALRENTHRLATAARVGGLGVWEYDFQTTQFHLDGASNVLLGRAASAVVMPLAELVSLFHPDDVPIALSLIREKTSEEKAYAARGPVEVRIFRSGGEIRWIRSGACVIVDEAQAAYRIVGFAVDITDARRGEHVMRDNVRLLEEERSRLAVECARDPLTGIGNRRSLESLFPMMFEEARCKGQSLCFGIVDIDHFKSFNDRYGHLEGDRALQAVVDALQHEMRAGDLLVRFGGEEFIFVLVAVEHPEKVIQRLLSAIRELEILHEEVPSKCLTVSCGCVCAPCLETTSWQTLAQASDAALYEAKLAGRDGYVFRTLERAND